MIGSLDGIWQRIKLGDQEIGSKDTRPGEAFRTQLLQAIPVLTLTNDKMQQAIGVGPQWKLCSARRENKHEQALISQEAGVHEWRMESYQAVRLPQRLALSPTSTSPLNPHPYLLS